MTPTASLTIAKREAAATFASLACLSANSGSVSTYSPAATKCLETKSAKPSGKVLNSALISGANSLPVISSGTFNSSMKKLHPYLCMC